MPDEIIRETISVTRRTITEEDKELAALYNRVVKRGLNHALWVLDYGPPAAQLRVATAAMSSAARLAAVDSKAEVESARLELERMFDDMTNVNAQRIVVTGPDAPVTPEWRELPRARTETAFIEPDDQA